MYELNYIPKNNEEKNVINVYQNLIDNWNDCKPDDFALLFSKHANLIGFHDNPIIGKDEIRFHLRQFFNANFSEKFIARIKEVRIIVPGVTILRAVAGFVEPGKPEYSQEFNFLQTMVAEKNDQFWNIALFHMCWGHSHNKLELVKSFTKELNQSH